MKKRNCENCMRLRYRRGSEYCTGWGVPVYSWETCDYYIPYNANSDKSRRHKVQVQKIDLESGKVVKIYRSFTDAARDNGCTYQNIQQAVNNRGIAKGYLWRRLMTGSENTDIMEEGDTNG